MSKRNETYQLLNDYVNHKYSIGEAYTKLAEINHKYNNVTLISVDKCIFDICKEGYVNGEKLEAIKILMEEAAKVKYKLTISAARDLLENY